VGFCGILMLFKSKVLECTKIPGRTEHEMPAKGTMLKIIYDW
jgi:hypothetical protein